MATPGNINHGHPALIDDWEVAAQVQEHPPEQDDGHGKERPQDLPLYDDAIACLPFGSHLEWLAERPPKRLNESPRHVKRGQGLLKTGDGRHHLPLRQPVNDNVACQEATDEHRQRIVAVVLNRRHAGVPIDDRRE